MARKAYLKCQSYTTVSLCEKQNQSSDFRHEVRNSLILHYCFIFSTWSISHHLAHLILCLIIFFMNSLLPLKCYVPWLKKFVLFIAVCSAQYTISSTISDICKSSINFHRLNLITSCLLLRSWTSTSTLKYKFKNIFIFCHSTEDYIDFFHCEHR